MHGRLGTSSVLCFITSWPFEVYYSPPILRGAINRGPSNLNTRRLIFGPIFAGIIPCPVYENLLPLDHIVIIMPCLKLGMRGCLGVALLACLFATTPVVASQRALQQTTQPPEPTYFFPLTGNTL